ncbi:MAG TPA: adenylate/guanylate cyclase domain-containing protein [Gaiellaceae bacterium]|nr:adenylate/guanylate cyclase domain-containing protein [Gaiellaceae bacterium]
MSGPPNGTVTLLFSDIEGSTKLLRRTGDAYAELLAEHRRLLSEAFARHRGFEMDNEGDAFFVAFKSANDAAAAASEAQRALAEHDWPDGNEIRVRMGLHTGDPRTVDGRYVGLVVHAAARIMAAGHGGQVLLSEPTRALLDKRFLLRDLGAHELKDLPGSQQLYQLQVDGLAADFPPLKTLDHRPTNLPVEPNAFIGRTRELKEAWSLLTRADARLLTLTGTGGAGKTRLALRLAGGAIEQFPNGVFFVSLAPVRDWELVVPSIAQTLGLREQPGETVLETLTEYVRDRRMLLLLDNFEQVLPAAPALSGLLGSAPELNVLVTSRTPLRIAGERTYSVPPLEGSESVNLFVERAQAADVEFNVTDENAPAVAEICARLDGLPLAIELAAPRVRALPPAALLRRLDDRLRLLTGGASDLDERQRTIRATIEWSYDLLTEAERVLFAQLGVFVGGCRLEAAEALSNADLDILDGLQSLVENSLLRRRADSDGEPRFWMLETLREYARELLEAEGDAAEARRRYAEHYADEAERLDVESRTGDHPAVLARLDEERNNMRRAVAWARENADGDLMLRLATALWGFWAARGYVGGGRRALEDALAVSGKRPARALVGLCTLKMLTGDSEGVSEDAAEALRSADDDFTLAQVWNLLGRIDGSVLGQLGQAEHAWRHALTHAERGGFAAERADVIGWLLMSTVFGPLPVDQGIARCNEFLELAGDDPTIWAWCCTERSVLEAMGGEFERARELLAEGKRALTELGLTLAAVNTAHERFLIENLAGSPEAATEVLRESYEALEEMGERGFLSTTAGFLSHTLYAQGEYGESARFSRTCEQLAEPDDVPSQTLWRRSRAKLSAHEGDLAGAEALAREAVRLCAATDLLNSHAEALVDLAEILAFEGRRDEALAVLEEAAGKYRQKGNVASLRHAEELSASLASG